MGETPIVYDDFLFLWCEIKSIIDRRNIIGSDDSHARVDEETALVCDQRRRTGGATAVRGLDDDGWYSETCVVLIVRRFDFHFFLLYFSIEFLIVKKFD